MSASEPVSVFVAPDGRVANMVVEWLLEKRIPAEARADSPTTSSDPLTGATSFTPAGTVQVVVTDPSRVEQAKQIVADRVAEIREAHAKRQARQARSGTVAATCEECGKSSDWAASEMGTTQDCPHCGSYMDVPDPDENWDDEDFSGDEPE